MATIPYKQPPPDPGEYTPFIHRKLRVLGCPFSLEKECTVDWKTVRDIVVWLEEEKIRLYPRRKRVPLRTADNPDAWWPLMKQYCGDLEIPMLDGVNTSNTATVADFPRQLVSLLDALTSVAIGDVYQDALEANTVRSQTKSAIWEEQKVEGHPLADSAATRAEIQAALEPFLTLLELPSFQESEAQEDSETISALKAVAARLRLCPPSCATKPGQRTSPTDEELQQIMNRVLVALPDRGRGNKQFLTLFLSGLRALHICIMRDTHERLEVVVEGLQTLVGNPVTDSKLVLRLIAAAALSEKPTRCLDALRWLNPFDVGIVQLPVPES